MRRSYTLLDMMRHEMRSGQNHLDLGLAHREGKLRMICCGLTCAGIGIGIGLGIGVGVVLKKVKI